MDSFETENLTEEETIDLFYLWNKEYPKILQYFEIDGLRKYLNALKEPRHVLYKDSTGKVKAWYCDFLRDEERWFAMILQRELQGKGMGTQILQHAKVRRSHLNGWVILKNTYKRSDGETYYSPAAFYIKNGFQIFEDITLNIGIFSAVKMEWKKTPGS